MGLQSSTNLNNFGSLPTAQFNKNKHFTASLKKKQMYWAKSVKKKKVRWSKEKRQFSKFCNCSLWKYRHWREGVYLDCKIFSSTFSHSSKKDKNVNGEELHAESIPIRKYFFCFQCHILWMEDVINKFNRGILPVYWIMMIVYHVYVIIL